MNKQIENETNACQYEGNPEHIPETPLLLLPSVGEIIGGHVPDHLPLVLEPSFHDNFVISGPVNDPAAFSKLVELAKEETLW